MPKPHVIRPTVLALVAVMVGALAAPTGAVAATRASVPATDFLAFSVHRTAVSNPQVRLGISLALDRPALAAITRRDRFRVSGTRTLPVAGLVAPGISGAATIDRASTAFFRPTSSAQVDAAKTALAAGGYVAGTPITIGYSATGTGPALAAEVQKDLAAAGVTVQLQVLPRSGKVLASAYDAVFAAWVGDYLRADNYLSAETCRNARYVGGYCDLAYDHLLASALATRSSSVFLARLTRLEGMLTGPAGAYPIAPFAAELISEPASMLSAPPALPATCLVCRT